MRLFMLDFLSKLNPSESHKNPGQNAANLIEQGKNLHSYAFVCVSFYSVKTHSVGISPNPGQNAAGLIEQGKNLHCYAIIRFNLLSHFKL